MCKGIKRKSEKELCAFLVWFGLVWLGSRLSHSAATLVALCCYRYMYSMPFAVQYTYIYHYIHILDFLFTKLRKRARYKFASFPLILCVCVLSIVHWMLVFFLLVCSFSFSFSMLPCRAYGNWFSLCIMCNTYLCHAMFMRMCVCAREFVFELNICEYE